MKILGLYLESQIIMCLNIFLLLGIFWILIKVKLTFD